MDEELRKDKNEEENEDQDPKSSDALRLLGINRVKPVEKEKLMVGSLDLPLYFEDQEEEGL